MARCSPRDLFDPIFDSFRCSATALQSFRMARHNEFVFATSADALPNNPVTWAIYKLVQIGRMAISKIYHVSGRLGKSLTLFCGIWWDVRTSCLVTPRVLANQIVRSGDSIHQKVWLIPPKTGNFVKKSSGCDTEGSEASYKALVVQISGHIRSGSALWLQTGSHRPCSLVKRRGCQWWLEWTLPICLPVQWGLVWKRHVFCEGLFHEQFCLAVNGYGFNGHMVVLNGHFQDIYNWIFSGQELTMKTHCLDWTDFLETPRSDFQVLTSLQLGLMVFWIPSAIPKVDWHLPKPKLTEIYQLKFELCPLAIETQIITKAKATVQTRHFVRVEHLAASIMGQAAKHDGLGSSNRVTRGSS